MPVYQRHTFYGMFMPIFRYKFESNSQLQIDLWTNLTGCLCLSLDTSLKAIHNTIWLWPDKDGDVYAYL